MIGLKRLALLKHGAPPRNVFEAALRAKWGGGSAGYEKTVGPLPIISISDAKAKPAKSLVVSMEPIQDLHGYDNPWPAGGGKNLCYEDASHLFPRGDGLSIIENAETLTAYAKVSPNTDYVFSCATTPFRSAVYGCDSEPAVGVTVHLLTNTTPTPTSRAFNSGAYEWVGFYYGTVEYAQTNVMIEAGTTPSTFAPYENLCPISGRTGVTVERTGKNLLNLVESEMITSGWNRAFPITVKAGTYIISCQNKFGPSSAYGAMVFFTDESNTVIKNISNGYNFGQSEFVGVGTTITAEEARRIKRIVFYLRASGATYNDIIQGNIQLELGSTASEYSAYSGETYPVAFPDSVGTVYGGTVDPVSGLLTVDRYYFKGGWTQYNSSNGFRAYRSAVVPYAKYLADVDNKPMSNTIGKFGSFSSSAMTENIIQPPRNNSSNAYMALDENVSPDDVDLCYLVAEPQTYQLTPTQIQMLKGANTLWSNADDLTLTYIGTTPANLLGGMLGGGLGGGYTPPAEEPEEEEQVPEEEQAEADPEEVIPDGES